MVATRRTSGNCDRRNYRCFSTNLVDGDKEEKLLRERRATKLSPLSIVRVQPACAIYGYAFKCTGEEALRKTHVKWRTNCFRWCHELPINKYLIICSSYNIIRFQCSLTGNKCTFAFNRFNDVEYESKFVNSVP